MIVLLPSNNGSVVPVIFVEAMVMLLAVPLPPIWKPVVNAVL